MTTRNQPLKRRQSKRDWKLARIKIEKEEACRVCGLEEGRYVNGYVVFLEAAHTIGKKHDPTVTTPRGASVKVVLAESVVPLCSSTPEREGCHDKYDARKLDLLPYLTPEEQSRAVLEAGGIMVALRRLTGGGRTSE